MRAIKLSMTILLALLIGSQLTLAQNESERWLRVEVTDEAGVPIKNACVTLVPKEGDIIFRKADGRGVVKVKKPAASHYRVIVKVDGYEAQKREVSLDSKTETVAFTLQPRAN